MREIKFRAWNIPSTKMFYWPSIQELVAIPNMTYHDRRNFEPDCNHFMQFTGLHDKNGKEIYEGDVLESVYTNQHGTFKHRSEVKVNGTYTGNGEYDEETIVGGWKIDTKTFHPIENFEVIGNIYENPELLKGQTKE